MFVLILALSAIVVWWLTNNLLLSVLMVTAIDGIAMFQLCENRGRSHIRNSHSGLS